MAIGSQYLYSLSFPLDVGSPIYKDSNLTILFDILYFGDGSYVYETNGNGNIISKFPYPSATPTITPTISLSVTPSVTPTNMPDITPTKTPTITPTISPTITPTITPFQSGPEPSPIT